MCFVKYPHKKKKLTALPEEGQIIIIIRQVLEKVL
jgi:hypothetical protein